ncbi:MAG TPA: MFS transporter [Stellaceae bacterium]|jgi:MFS family permease|nr:MFS transporter [Stellaceae bacterium]
MSEAGSGENPGSDAATDKRPRGEAAVSWDAFLSTYLPALVLAIGTGIALPAIPTLAKTYAVSFGMASGIVTAFVLGNVFGTIPSGWLIDRFGNRIVLISAPLITSVTSFAIFFSDDFTELLILRFLTGMAAQMWQMARLAAISYGAAPSQRGRLVSWMFGMDSTGRLAGPIIGGFIAASWGPRAPFIVFAAMALIALIPTSTFGKDTPRQSKSDKKARTMSLRDLILPRLVYFGVALFAGMTRGPLNADLLHLYAAFAYNLGPAQIGYLATAASCLSLPIGFTGGWIMDRFGRKRTMVPGFTGVTIAMALLAVSAFAHLSLAWYVGLFLLGVATQALTGGSVQTVGADVAPAEARGTFLGIWRFTGQGGVALGPIIFALVADQVDYGTAFLFTSSCAAVVAFLLIRYVPETGRQTD